LQDFWESAVWVSIKQSQEGLNYNVIMCRWGNKFTKLPTSPMSEMRNL